MKFEKVIPVQLILTLSITPDFIFIDSLSYIVGPLPIYTNNYILISGLCIHKAPPPNFSTVSYSNIWEHKAS